MQRVGLKSSQRGMTLIGLILAGIVVAAVVIVAAKVVPTATEYMAINKAAKKAAAEGSSVADVRQIFERAKIIENFDAVSGKDLEITKNGDDIVVNFAYDKEIALAGPAYLLLKYRGGTGQGYR